MATFVTGDLALPPDKQNGLAVPVGMENKYGRAEDFNYLRDAAGDLRDHTRGWVNARSYGLACDGVTEDYPALAAMLAMLGTRAATLVVPGPCLVGTNITIPATLPVRFEGAGAFTGGGTVTFTRWTPGGSQIGASSLFTAAPRQSKSWILRDTFTNNNFTGVGAADGTGYGTGTRGIVDGTNRLWLQTVLASSASSNSGVWTGGSANWSRGSYLPKFATRARLNSMTNTTTLFSVNGAGGGSGLFYVPTLGGSNGDTAIYVCINCDSRVGTHWIIGSSDGATATWVDSGVVANMTDDWLLIMEYLTGTSVKATITNCTSGVSVSITKATNMPAASVPVGPNVGAYNWAATVNAGPYFEYVYMEHN